MLVQTMILLVAFLVTVTLLILAFCTEKPEPKTVRNSDDEDAESDSSDSFDMEHVQQGEVKLRNRRDKRQ